MPDDWAQRSLFYQWYLVEFLSLAGGEAWGSLWLRLGRLSLVSYLFNPNH